MCQSIRSFSAVLVLLACCVAIGGCASGSPMGREIDYASGGAIWRDKGGVICKIKVTPADATPFSAQLIYHVPTHKLVIQRLHDGALEQVGYGDGRLWMRAVPPDDVANWTLMVIFGSYLAVPFDLSDPAVSVRELQPIRVANHVYRIGLVHRPSESGKWAVFIGADDRIPRALVPLAPKPSDKGNYKGKDAVPLTRGYAVVYEKVVTVESVSLPSRWSVWNWDSRDGVTGGPIATVELIDPVFGNIQPSASPQFDRNVSNVGGRWWR